MPEMLQYCGRRIRVHKRAHKTCDFVTNTGIRRLEKTIHLEQARCDGSAHGNCQAQCLLFWKEAWVRRVPHTDRIEAPAATAQSVADATAAGARCSEESLVAACTSSRAGNVEPIYSCQATLLPAFTRAASGWDIRLYIKDYTSGNVASLRQMIPRFIYRGYDNLVNLGIGWGSALRWLYDRVQHLRHGVPYPARTGTIPKGSPTPTGTLELQPGEWVRVKSYQEILRTLDTSTKNRGMAFSAEMVPFCGKVFRVQSRVSRIVDEKTGKLLQMKNPCIILEGVACQARYNNSMLFCPRATYAYWREIWVERVPEQQAMQSPSFRPIHIHGTARTQESCTANSVEHRHG
jgi:hypothetical protein